LEPREVSAEEQELFTRNFQGECSFPFLQPELRKSDNFALSVAKCLQKPQCTSSSVMSSHALTLELPHSDPARLEVEDSPVDPQPR
jgi:hypothetical protein